MAYIGRQLARGENKLFDDISSSFNGSTTTFNLTVSSVATSTATPFQLFVSLGGVMQKPNTDFTTAGNQITFTTAPAAGLSCWIMMQGDTIDQAAIPDSSVTPSKISGSNFAFSGDLRLNDADSSNYVGFKAPTTVSSNIVWTLPAADTGVSGYVLSSNGSGVLSWVESGDNSSPSFTGDVTLTDDGALVGTSSFNATYTGSVKTYTVTVASKSAAHRYNGSGSGSGYKINGKESPFLTLTPGRTYKFDQADGSNSGHPLRFYLEANKTTAYTTGVTTNGTAGNAGAYTQIVVSDTTPQVLHYQCSAHALMGNAVQTNSNVAAAGSLNGSTLASSVTASSLTSVGTLGSLAVTNNVTVGGNFTVSGTTTTVDSVTLSVKDKNIEMGVVSSPSDTTADGGGITLKGSSDHTFNWVNSTDAWTSSEHIHLGDNKKLLVGTGSDLEIYHDGTNTKLMNSTGYVLFRSGGGTLYLDGSNIQLRSGDGGENYLICNDDGAVEINHNNVKKLETTATGINVTGAIQVNGAALSSAPTITATADGAIAANKPVVLNTNGSVSTIGGNTDANGSRVSAHSDTTLQSRVVFDPDTGKSVFFWCENGSGNTMQYKVATSNSSNVISFGTERTAVSGSVASIDAVYSTVHNKFIIAYRGTNTNLYFRAGSMDAGNDSITWGGEVAAPAQGSIVDFQFRLACDDDNGTAMCHYKKSGADNYIVGMVTNSSNNNLTVGSTYVDYGSNIQADAASIVYDTNNNKYVMLWETGSTLKVSYATVNSSNGNAGGEGGLTNVATYHTFDAQLQYDPTNQVFVAGWGKNSDNRVKARAFTFNGTAFTFGTEIESPYTGEVQERTASDVDMYYNPDANDFGFGYRENGNGYKFRLVRFQVSSGTTLIVSAADQEVGSDGYIALLKMAYDTTLDKVICSFDDGNGARGMVFSPASTNLTNKMFIGFSTAAYSDTDTATIAITGNTTTQSSLTVGTTYYVQRDGTIATTAATPSVLAGKAISTTKLLIRDVTS